MKIATIAFLSLLTLISSKNETQEIHFDVYLKGSKVGHFLATEILTPENHIRDLKTKSNTTVIAISVHIETEATITRKNGVVTEGVAYRNANRGLENLHTKTKLIGDNKYQVNKNGKTQVKDNFNISWCVTDLFFKEPQNLTWVYSNMHGEKLKVNSMGNGRYQVVSNEASDIFYTYKNGKLMMTETDTPLGKVVSKRN